MALIKVAEASDIVLDWLVAQCEGYTNLRRNAHRFNNDWIVDSPHNQCDPLRLTALGYSTDPAMAWPIIERELIHTYTPYPCPDKRLFKWLGRHNGQIRGSGPTSLIAAMRCYVTSKLGDVVEVPDELLKG